MNVVHVNASDGHGGAGRAFIRLHQALQQHGVRSRALVQRGGVCRSRAVRDGLICP